ncbi:hypothetical protein JW906_12330 [bacterium]|nr:hypothetical protein [bacterium]
MLPFNSLTILAVLFGILGLIFLGYTIGAIRKKKFLRSTTNLLSGLLMLTVSALFFVISISIQGYRALTKEVTAAVVRVEPLDHQKFIARFSIPGEDEKIFSIAGDQLYVDAHILKWKPVANLFGLHTAYELDRVGGRYFDLEDERNKLRTIYSLSKEKTLDMFNLRRRFAVLSPLVDAEYGSATYIQSDVAEEFRVRVSTTGLLIRKAERPLMGPRL